MILCDCSLSCAGCLFSLCALQCGLETNFWSGINHFFIWGSIVVYFCMTLLMHTALLELEYEGVVFNCMNTANFWFTIILCAVILLVPVLAEKFYYADTRPSLTDKVMIVALLWFFLLSTGILAVYLDVAVNSFSCWPMHNAVSKILQ